MKSENENCDSGCDCIADVMAVPRSDMFEVISDTL